MGWFAGSMRELVGLIVGEDQPEVVHGVEGDEAGQPEPLVAVDERMIGDHRVQQRRGLLVHGA